MSGLTRENDRKSAAFRLQGYHLLWRNFPGPSARSRIFDFRPGLQSRDTHPATPTAKRLQACRQSVWAIFPVRSPLLRKSSFLSLPEVTEMFQFTSFALPTYGFSRQCRGMNPDPFPDSDICGSKSGWRLTAAYRSRPTSFIASQRQDILQAP